jgi:hypothetical protein
LLGFFESISKFFHLAQTEAAKSLSFSHNLLSFSQFKQYSILAGVREWRSEGIRQS